MKIEVLVRAIIQNKGKILVCNKIGKHYFFFPGGHLGFGENVRKALNRELKEELGLKIKKSNFIGVSDHLFTEDGEKHHEINLVFEVKTDKLKFKSRENHLQFFLKTKKELSKEKVLPKILTKAILKWLKDKKPFWTSQI
ncbi:MAG: NUDIX domain-containing protein [Candidatus Nealsonbacteria bacterium]|nr:NUDIX domain-containing protein [Candidatus Nealsonbacteria bacterium]